MAGSRLERIGTIYSRTTGLIQSGALRWEDRPIWYDIYEAFPPKQEPRFDRPAPNMKLNKIFYKEDKIRALFHTNNKQIGATTLLSSSKTITQRFIETYNKLKDQYNNDITEGQIYTEAIELLNRERASKRQAATMNEEESVSLSLAFKQAQKNQEDPGIKIKVKDIFKD